MRYRVPHRSAATQAGLTPVLGGSEMSFDLYIQSFENGAPAGVPKEFVRQVLGSHLTEIEPDYWTITLSPEESCSVFPTVHEDSPDLVHGLSIGNPCDNPVLWQCLYSLMGQGNSVLYFAGGPGPLVLDPLVAGHLPYNLLESLGRPIIVSSGHDIKRIVGAA